MSGNALSVMRQDDQLSTRPPACTGEDALPKNGALRVRHKLITEGSPGRPAQSGLQPAVREQMPALAVQPRTDQIANTPRNTRVRPAPFLLLLLHDFPDPGRSHRFPCSSPPSDTFSKIIFRYLRKASSGLGTIHFG
jgi:hypothetical protein